MAKKNLQPTTYNLQPIRSPLQPTTYHLPPNRGFAMLFSVLISSLLVVIGLSIFNITLKELTISTSARESQVAFYAANSGLECALYWDLQKGAFATSTDDISRATLISAVCNGVTVNNTVNPHNADSATTKFEFKINDPNDLNGPCANVTVTKTPGSPTAEKMTTVIESRGKNICSASGRRVERGLKATIITQM